MQGLPPERGLLTVVYLGEARHQFVQGFSGAHAGGTLFAVLA